MTDVFTAVLELTIVSAIVTVLLLLFEKLISKRFSAKLYYFAWLVLAVRMMLPISLPTIEAPVNVKIPDRTVTVTYADPPQQTVPDMPHTDQSTDVNFTMPEDLPVFIYPTPERPQQQVEESIPLSSIACSIWLCGAAAVLIYYVIQYFVFRIRLRKRISVSDQSILGVLDGVCTDLNIKNASVSYFDGAKGPMLVGYFRPIIVLPSDYSCDERTLDLIFTHELTHFKRRDLWYKLFMNVVSAVYWFNPFAWIMRSNAFKAVELSCDCDVVKDRPTEYRGQYSKAILSEVASRHAASQGYSTYFANDKRIL
ncbi:MAG: M56 family metallopeptidase, partial [Clostridia bacterium]|nr:M56 family metallopeptidase [Clostridia bacterium]